MSQEKQNELMQIGKRSNSLMVSRTANIPRIDQTSQMREYNPSRDPNLQKYFTKKPQPAKRAAINNPYVSRVCNQQQMVDSKYRFYDFNSERQIQRQHDHNTISYRNNPSLHPQQKPLYHHGNLTNSNRNPQPYMRGMQNGDDYIDSLREQMESSLQDNNYQRQPNFSNIAATQSQSINHQRINLVNNGYQQQYHPTPYQPQNPMYSSLEHPQQIPLQSPHLQYLNNSMDLVNKLYYQQNSASFNHPGSITRGITHSTQPIQNIRSLSRNNSKGQMVKRQFGRLIPSLSIMNRVSSKDSFLNLARNSSFITNGEEAIADDIQGDQNRGLVRPMSKQDLFDVFNSYRQMLGEDKFVEQDDPDKKKVFNRLYDDSKTRQQEQHRSQSKANLFDKQNDLDNNGVQPSPLIPTHPINYDPTQPIYEARRYLKEVIVTFKGLKKEKLWQ